MKASGPGGFAAVPFRLFRFFRRPLSTEAADAELAARLRLREGRFLDVARRMFFREGSPYRRLLDRAGCEFADLEAIVNREGVETALERIAAEGVRISLDEYEGRRPIERPGLAFAVTPRDFENPSLPAFDLRVSGSSSGSAGPPKRFRYTLPLLAETAVNERLLLEAHGLVGVPRAHWYPTLPSLAGIGNLLSTARAGDPPRRWFSHFDPDSPSGSAALGLAVTLVIATARLAGRRLPRPQATSLADAPRVADWLRRSRDRHGRAALWTYASSAVRVARAAQEAGWDLSDCAIFTGGEPLTPTRARYIERTKARVFGRFVITETGAVAGGCPVPRRPGEMHLYRDRIAVICAGSSKVLPSPILLTTISTVAPMAFLNVDLGDSAVIGSAACGCRLGGAGLATTLGEVRNDRKFTAEGSTVAFRDLEAIVSRIVEEADGAPDQFQLWTREDASGLVRFGISLAPGLYDRIAPDLPNRIRADIAGLPGGETSARLWAQGSTISVIRGEARYSSRFKLTSPDVDEDSP